MALAKASCPSQLGAPLNNGIQSLAFSSRREHMPLFSGALIIWKVTHHVRLKVHCAETQIYVVSAVIGGSGKNYFGKRGVLFQAFQ
jgi:hypothetical protein